MRTVTITLMLSMTACSPVYVAQPGQYKDFADYQVQKDPSLMNDVKAMGGGPEDAHCVADYILGVVYGGGNKGWLDDRATGRSITTSDDKNYIESMMRQFKADKQKAQAAYRQAFDYCQHFKQGT
jgi:hypothetical protein